MAMNFRHAGCRHAKAAGQCVLDGEWIAEQNAFACFDAYYVNGKDVRDLKLSGRLEALRGIIAEGAFLPLQGFSDAPSFSVKDFAPIDSIDGFREACVDYGKREAAGAFPFEVDGLVFTPAEDGVPKAGGSWPRVFKWKPPEKNTVDFVARPRWEDAELTATGATAIRVDLYAVNDGKVLFGAVDVLADRVSKKMQWVRKSRGSLAYFDRTYVVPLRGSLACESGEALEDGTIAECRYDLASKRWIPMRARHDKMRLRTAEDSWFGTANAYATARSVFHAILHPVTLRDLTRVQPYATFDVSEAGAAYYEEEDAGGKDSRSMRLFHNAWVKNKSLLQPLRAARPATLLDVACGRGGDIKKWAEMGIERVLGVDVMEDGLSEAIRRASAQVSLGPEMLFLRMDASKPFEDPAQYADLPEDEAAIARVVFGLAEPLRDDSPMSRRLTAWQKTKLAGFDVVTCMFALHYFCKDPVALSSLIDNVRGNLKPGGMFAGVCLDGRIVDDRLRGIERGAGVGSRDGAWHVTKLYEAFEPVGSAIRVYNGNIGTAQDEYLVDFEFVVGEFARKGLHLIDKKRARKLGLKAATGTFDLLYDELAKADLANNKAYAEAYAMTEGEKEYSFMNRFFVFEHAE
jgi:SAM-dependent methyltransferase